MPSEVLTFAGLRKLEEMKLAGEEFPENWKALVLKYIERRQQVYERKKEDLESEKMQCKEALKICRKLGIILTFKF